MMQLLRQGHWAGPGPRGKVNTEHAHTHHQSRSLEEEEVEEEGEKGRTCSAWAIGLTNTVSDTH